jgi:rod shape determining protein RodA
MFQRSIKRFNLSSLIAPWQEMDWLLLFLVVGMTTLGGLMIRSTELHKGFTDWGQHWITGLVGLGIAMTIARFRYENLLPWKWAVYGFINLSLVAVRFLGTEALGAQRWINIAGFNVQPSEFAKIGIIVTLAALLHNETAKTIPNMIKVLAVTAVPWAFVFIEPNLGTSLVFGAITMGMLYWGNANPGWLVLLVSPVISALILNVSVPFWGVWIGLVFAIGWFCLPWSWLGGLGAMIINLISGTLGHMLWQVLKDYQKDRILMFLDPDKDPLGGGYHLIQSRIAIGAGGMWGKGLYQGTQTQLNFIPEQHTDFIFSAIGEELGFVGCICVLFVFWLICLRLVIIAQNAKDNFGSLIAIGYLSMLVFQVVVNIGMNIGIAPITGIPLPLLSYGRSSLLANFIGLGLVESVFNHRHQKFF